MENKNIENEIKLENLTTETILTNLKILSNIKPTDKLTQNGDLLMIDPTDFTQCVKRWWNNNSRIHTMDAIERIIDQTFITIDKIYNSEIQNTVDINVDNNYIVKEFFKRLSVICSHNFICCFHAELKSIMSKYLIRKRAREIIHKIN